jgi:hypothetical protein
VDPRHSNRLRSEVGLSLTSSWKMGQAGCFAPKVWLSGINECYLVKQHSDARFTGQQPSFGVRTWNKPLYRLSPGMELSLLFSKGFNVSLRYSAELGEAAALQKLAGRLEWFF